MSDPMAVTWPTSSNPGFGPGEGNGRVVNCYAYQDGPNAVRWRAFPGLDAFSAISGNVRGMAPFEGGVAAVVGNFIIGCVVMVIQTAIACCVPIAIGKII